MRERKRERWKEGEVERGRGGRGGVPERSERMIYGHNSHT